MCFLAFATRRPVAAGEMLTIAYVAEKLSRRGRQRALRTQYGFECECSRCVAEAKAEARRWRLCWQATGLCCAIVGTLAVARS